MFSEPEYMAWTTLPIYRPARTQVLVGNRMTIARTNPAMMFPMPRQIAIRGNRSFEGGNNAKTSHAEKHAAITTIPESTFAVLRLGFILLTDGRRWFADWFVAVSLGRRF